MPDTIGQRLKQAREDKRLSLEKAAEATRIRLIYLQALENDDYSVMISAAQGRGFLHNYAEFLGMDLDAVVEEVKSAMATVEKASAQEDSSPESIPTAEQTGSPDASQAARPGFWSRLLRRSAPQSTTEPEALVVSESHTETEITLIEATSAAQVEETVAPVALEEEPVKPARRKTRAASDTAPKRKPGAATGKKKLLTV